MRLHHEKKSVSNGKIFPELEVTNCDFKPSAMTAPFHVETGPPGRLLVRFPYSAERLALIRMVLGRLWHADLKAWSIPVSELPRLRELLAAPLEPSAQTAAPAMPLPSDAVQRLRQAAMARHLSPRTIEAYSGWA